MDYDPILWGSHELGECWINAAIKAEQEEGTIFMQYIGRKDEEGNEVYEGDVIVLICGCCFYEIEYQKEKARFWPKDDGHSQVHVKDIDVFSCEFKIFGNIYENPEPLT